MGSRAARRSLRWAWGNENGQKQKKNSIPVEYSRFTLRTENWVRKARLAAHLSKAVSLYFWEMHLLLQPGVSFLSSLPAHQYLLSFLFFKPPELRPICLLAIHPLHPHLLLSHHSSISAAFFPSHLAVSFLPPSPSFKKPVADPSGLLLECAPTPFSRQVKSLSEEEGSLYSTSIPASY